MFYYQTFFPLPICSYLHCSQQIPEEKIGGHRARLREKKNLFRYRAQFEGNLLRFARARAHVRALMTQKSCAVEMRSAIPRNYLKWVKSVIFEHHWFENCSFRSLYFSSKLRQGPPVIQPKSQGVVYLLRLQLQQHETLPG